MKVFEYIAGNLPILISMPHLSADIPENIRADMTEHAHSSIDTDWYVDQLYDFAKQMGAYWIEPKWSRYVIDLNRDPSGQSLYPGSSTTELCPTTSFAEQPLYQANKEPDSEEIQRRIETYWRPYHQQLEAAIKAIHKRFGYVILFEAHSIASVVPRFFDGTLSDFNFGTNDNKTCSSAVAKVLTDIDLSPFSKVCNQRFKGGYITRAYANPEVNITTIQLELSQASYLNEGDKTWSEKKYQQLKPKLESLFEALLAAKH